MTPDYELQAHNAKTLEDHRMRELEEIDTREKIYQRLREYYRGTGERLDK